MTHVDFNELVKRVSGRLHTAEQGSARTVELDVIDVTLMLNAMNNVSRDAAEHEGRRSAYTEVINRLIVALGDNREC